MGAFNEISYTKSSANNLSFEKAVGRSITIELTMYCRFCPNHFEISKYVGEGGVRPQTVMAY